MNTLESLDEMMKLIKSHHPHIVDTAQYIYEACIEDLHRGEDEEYAISLAKIELGNLIKQQYGS